MFYSSVESAYQAQKFNFLKDFEGLDNRVKNYQKNLEFDQPFGVDINMTKLFGSKEIFSKMNIVLNVYTWNYHKYDIMNDILITRYNTDIVFKYIVDVMNNKNIELVCSDKNRYWSGKISSNGKKVAGNNNLGLIIQNLH